MFKQTGSLDLKAANGKNKVFYQGTKPTGGTYTAGDTWFDTSNGLEMHRYNGSSWVKAGLTSAAFSTVEIGGASIGFLSSLLIFNDDDYWNLSDENITIGAKTYAANTLRTSHLIAREDIDVQGGSGSVIKIPTNSQEAGAYTELSEGGLKNVSVYNYKTVTTKFPSDSDDTILWALKEYTGATEIERVDLSMGSLRFDVYDSSYTLDHHKAYYGADSMQIYDGVHSMPIAAITGSLKEVRFGTSGNKVSLKVNGRDISAIAEGYPSQAGHIGACTIWQYNTNHVKYLSFGLDPVAKKLYVYGSNDPDDVAYVGQVALS